MYRTFIQTKQFSYNWDRLGFSDADLRRLELELLSDPSRFPVMQGTGGLRKIRVPMEQHGKSAGARVCYVDFVLEEVIYLITVYPKNEKENLTPAERNNIRKAIDTLRRSLQEERK